MFLKTASACLFVATVALALLHRKEQSISAPRAPEDEVLRVSFDDVRIGGVAKCKIRYDSAAGAEFKATAWGMDIAMLAFDRSRYWFWIKDYDPKSHFTCAVDSVGRTDLIPPLRPSFMEWVVNENVETSKFMDGEYEVEIDRREGVVSEQRYTRNGRVESRVVVRAFQESSGKKFPALATIEFDGKSIEINLGSAETTNPIRPKTQPPNWSEPVEIAP